MTMLDPATGLPVAAPPAPPAQPAPQQPTPLIVQVPPPPPPAQNGEQPITRAELDEMLGRVRQEEKDKLYPELERLKGIVDGYEAQRTAAEQAEADRLAAEEAERQRLEAEGMTAAERIEAAEAAMRDEVAKLQGQLETERALRLKEAELANLDAYRTRRLQEEADNIVPQLVDFVRGNTPEEIEASIAQMVERSNAIAADAQQAFGTQRRQIQMPVTSGPPVDAMGGLEDGQRQVSPQDIMSMDLETYRQNRQALLGAVSQRVREQGPYAQ